MTPELESSLCSPTWPRGSGMGLPHSLLSSGSVTRRCPLSLVTPRVLSLPVPGEMGAWERFQLQSRAGFVYQDLHPAFLWGKGELDETHSDSCHQQSINSSFKRCLELLQKAPQAPKITLIRQIPLSA